MPVTDQDARALAYLARRIRQETPGAPRWDQAGIDAVTAKLVGKPLAPTVERVARHAADKDARTPGAILRPFLPGGELDGDRRPMPPKPDEACDTCGQHLDKCLGGHASTRPARANRATDPTPYIEQARAALRHQENS